MTSNGNREISVKSVSKNMRKVTIKEKNGKQTAFKRFSQQ